MFDWHAVIPSIVCRLLQVLQSGLDDGNEGDEFCNSNSDVYI